MDTKERQTHENPKETANPLSLLFFGWMIPIFWKGAKKDLEMTDLYDPLKSDESETLGDRLEREWKKELIKVKGNKLKKDKNEKSKKQPSLFLALTRVFWAPYLLQGVILFVQLMGLRIIQPILQGWVISYFNPGQNSMTQDQALIYAGCLILVTLGVIFTNHHYSQRTQQLGMCIRVSCCALIYRKVLRLNQAAVSSTASGQIANLISNDVARFDVIPLFLHYIWIMPFQIVLIGYVMWQSVSVAALVGIGAMMIQTIPVQGYLGHLSARLRSKIAGKTDERVQLMSELISGIQVVKMYSWEKPFELIVAKIRATEMKLISYTSYLRGFYMSIMVFSERVTLYLTLITFVLMGNTLTAETTFVMATLFNVLQLTSAICFPQAVIMASEANVSLKRITAFLLLDEVKPPKEIEPSPKDKTQLMEKPTTSQQFKRGIEIEMVNVSANWVHGQLPPTLCEVSMKVKNRSLTVLVGPVGSGKSSLLHLILNELSVGCGNLSIFSCEGDSRTRITSQDIRISYASQDAWLFSASIRDNILFGQPYNKSRYEEVTRVCALLKDFEQLPHGDLSYVGERGASLSGGQRARVNLARAVYADADLYLLDDPLSAVDTHVGHHLFEQCIREFLKNKTRILVTHQLQYLRQADSIIVINRGTVKLQGTHTEISESSLNILSSEDSEVRDEAAHVDENIEEQADEKTTIAATLDDSGQSSQDSDTKQQSKDVSDEQIETGTMSSKVYWGYFSAGGNICSLCLVAMAFIIGQAAANGSDYWVTYWTNHETLRATIKSNMSAPNGTLHPKHFLFESDWFDEFGLIRENVAVYIYTGCIVTSVTILILRSILFIRVCMNASRNIHNSMFANLLLATMRFFNTNPTGRILNRFSKDVGSMDELLPKAMLEALQIFTVMIGILTMVIVVNVWMIIPTVFLGGLFYTIRLYYLKTAQNIKRLEGIAKSPVFSHISSTLHGLTTIRSRGTPIRKLLQKEFDQHQDSHTGAWYLTISAATSFGFFLDLLSCLFIVSVCFSFILMDDGTTFGGSVGLAISQSLILTGMVQYGVRQSAEVVSQMTSVERVLQYTKLPKEGPFTTEKPPPPTWPSKGALVFRDVSMKYAANKPPVLKSLNIDIQPGWKIGIVGRTGAGKTSLISALFRLTGDGLEGEIVLDGIDTKLVGLHELRPRISIIPQEPILFSASLRYNLDPFEQYTDAEIWGSLREVELGDAVSSLEFKVAGGGANFSVGQRQLICLARAILRNNRVLVLDEATANVDRGTDALIQTTIRRRFANCTVLTIAHRLNTIMDSDRVIVMDGGRIAEIGHPHLLLQNPEGPFAQMVKQTGNGMATKLSETAETAYLSSPEFRKEIIDSNIFSTKETTDLKQDYQ